MIYRRIKYGALLYNNPVINLAPQEIDMLMLRIRDLDSVIENSQHLYHKELILNRLFAFYLDLSHIIEQRQDQQRSGLFTRYESIIKSFTELLIEHYTREHKVDFYARQLHITPHYLTLIVKQITGQTVNEFIVEMLYSEARNLLIHSKLSIQEIAAVLHFADQSSFGKFFKRHSGVSPIVFRKESSPS